MADTLGNLSDYFQSSLYNLILKGSAFAPGTLAFALCSGTPTDGQTGSNIPELASATPNYKRVTYIQAASGWQNYVANTASANTQPIQWPVAGAGWGTISGACILDNATVGAGNVLFFGNLTTPRLVLNGDQFQFSSGNFSVLFG